MGVHLPSTWEMLSEVDREATGMELDAPDRRDIVDQEESW